MAGTFDPLKLDNQICFPLYVCAKEVIRRYQPFLGELDLTYTQYIAMMALWEECTLSVKALGEKLCLDSGTLTPLLKALEKKGYILRVRSEKDERVVLISLTEEGEKLRDEAEYIPAKVSSCIDLPEEDAGTLYVILHRLMENLAAQPHRFRKNQNS